METSSAYYSKEKDLIEGILERKAPAFEKLYSDNQVRLTNMVLSNSGNKEDAEDVIQESVLILYKNFSKNDFELNSTVSTYLYAIAKRVWLRKLKSRSKKWVTSNENLELSVNSDIEERELQISRMRLYRKFLYQLDADCKKVLLMFFENISMEDIAKEMNYASAGYAKKRKYKCKNKLIEMIKADPLYKELTS